MLLVAERHEQLTLVPKTYRSGKEGNRVTVRELLKDVGLETECDDHVVKYFGNSTADT